MNTHRPKWNCTLYGNGAVSFGCIFSYHHHHHQAEEGKCIARVCVHLHSVPFHFACHTSSSAMALQSAFCSVAQLGLHSLYSVCMQLLSQMIVNVQQQQRNAMQMKIIHHNEDEDVAAAATTDVFHIVFFQQNYEKCSQMV